MGNQSLVLQSMGRNATGNYYCVATNAEGTTFSNPVQLDIKCKQNCNLKLLVLIIFSLVSGLILCTKISKLGLLQESSYLITCNKNI